MSQEYHEWVGSSFNDRFYMVMNAPVTTGGENRIINYTGCSDPGSYYDFAIVGVGPQCYIAINSAYSEPCPGFETDISGSGFACSDDGSSTGWLRTTWVVEPGETFTLTFHIHDTSDSSYNSAVVIDNFKWLGAGAKPGTEEN
jgi:hypothetical protein